MIDWLSAMSHDLRPKWVETWNVSLVTITVTVGFIQHHGNRKKRFHK